MVSRARSAMRASRPFTRSYSKGHFGLVLDMAGGTTAWVTSVSGGKIRGDISVERLNTEAASIKSLENVGFEPLVFKQALGAGRPIYEWIQQSWKRQKARHNGQVLHADFNRRVVFEQDFRDALISEVTFPGLDASSNEAGYLTVKIQPEEITLRRAPGGVRLFGFDERAAPKVWTVSSFRLSLFKGGRAIDCRAVRKIDSFSIKQSLTALHVGGPENRFPEWEGTGIEFPDLSLTVSIGQGDDFLAWQEDYLHRGQSSAQDEMTGYIEFLDGTGGQVLFTVHLDGVGMKGFELGENSVSEEIHTATVELYVQEMMLEMGAVAG